MKNTEERDTFNYQDDLAISVTIHPSLFRFIKYVFNSWHSPSESYSLLKNMGSGEMHKSTWQKIYDFKEGTLIKIEQFQTPSGRFKMCDKPHRASGIDILRFRKMVSK